jgi:glycosyltransferase involved in cell wall biosynthesis
VRISFVLNDLALSGGTNVVLQYAHRLSVTHGHDVTLLVRDDTRHSWAKQLTSGVHLLSWPEGEGMHWDLAIATYWETVLHLGNVSADSYQWFCQSLEDRFFPDRNPAIASMQLALATPVPVITEASWIRDLLQFLNPEREVSLVRNGIHKDVFFAKDSLSHPEGQIGVLVEGPLDSQMKNTEYALRSALRTEATAWVTHIGSSPFPTNDSRYRFVPSSLSFEEMADYYRAHHVILKTSRVEGMFGPPLEAFHCGTPAIVTPVTGAEEYIRDGLNALVVPWDDERALARALERLATQQGLWALLREGALETASGWPDWSTQAREFNEAVENPAPNSAPTQSDLRQHSDAIAFNDLMHWLAMRRLSDKTGGIRLVEEAWLERQKTDKATGSGASHPLRRILSARAK